MYQSRYHFTGGDVSIALDALSGELLELHDLRTGENFIKNSLFSAPQPLILTTKDGVRLYPPKTSQILSDPSLRCTITHDADTVTVHYTHLTDGEQIYAADVSYTVTFAGNETHWKLVLPLADGYTNVRFPCINGIYLGQTWEDDALYYPNSAGQKFDNPVEYFSRPMQHIQWRWQEYRYHYPYNSCCGWKNEDGMYAMRAVYPGGLSMSYLDYADGNSGLYFASHGEGASLVTLGAATPGPQNPCMCFYAQYELIAAPGEGFVSNDTVVALHGGDWHEGADIYRAYKELRLDAGLSHPDWFDKGAGLLAHYDFKYQNGGIVHTYRDIPALKQQAKDLGLNHLLYSGWHVDGFDNGFPQYYPDPELGTEEELHDGCVCGDDEIHSTFYINARIANVKYKDISDRVIIQRDGSQALERYGNAGITFGCMCPSSPGWQEELGQTLDRAKNRYGIDGVYLDCLAAGARFCFSKEHGHAPDDWCRGYKTILTGAEPLGLALMGEHVCDEYGPYLAGQLTQSFFNLKNGVFPEMYRYTFPAHTLMDMLYPSKNLAMRPVFVEQSSDRLMRSAFVDGLYFWIYDLEDDNTFTRDPEQLEKLKGVIRLRTFWLERFGKGIFRDTVGISKLPEDAQCMVRRYEMPDSTDILLACANGCGVCQTVTVCGRYSAAAVYTATSLQGSEVPVSSDEEKTVLTLPQTEYSLIYLTGND